MKVLITGGTGYIGSHICVELIEAGHEVVVIDNLSNSKAEVCGYIKEITGQEITFYQGDVLDEELVDQVFAKSDLDAVIHCAALKAVGESVAKPIEYYTNNLMGTLVVTKAMVKHGVNNIVFSSSATVYGDVKTMPVSEATPLGITTNPYGTSKAMMERILSDVQFAHPQMSVTLLRYFNPVGAHESGLIGEDPKGIPNNLVPYIMKVATGDLESLGVFGDDYDTPDGTGIRDYIHVVDLAKGHVLAIEKYQEPGVHITNLGTGVGYSVLDVVKAFEKANGLKIKYTIKDRRAGDIAICYADPTKAKEELGWVAQKNLEDMCRDTWNFAKTRLL